jgi:hypothetical protein
METKEMIAVTIMVQNLLSLQGAHRGFCSFERVIWI